MNDLTNLARAHGTDKATVHQYTRHYERHFARLRDQPIRLLEIGIGGYDDPKAGGGSLRMWREYFPQGQIVGLDVFDKRPHASDRIKIYQGSQDDPELLARIVKESGPFDIVIDDGSHVSSHILASFRALFQHGLTEYGVYAIEDLQTSYWKSFGGADPSTPGTSMGLVKSLCDGLNHAERHHGLFEYPTYTDRYVESVHCYHNLAFIEKGHNHLPSNLINGGRVPLSLRHPHLGRQVDRLNRGTEWLVRRTLRALNIKP